jgi:hypothetical protein
VLFKIMVFVVALLSVLVVACDAADSTWKTHQDQDCGIEVSHDRGNRACRGCADGLDLPPV